MRGNSLFLFAIRGRYFPHLLGGHRQEIGEASAFTRHEFFKRNDILNRCLNSKVYITIIEDKSIGLSSKSDRYT